MFFSKTHRTQLTAPFYSILFETSICQFISSKCSPVIPDEVKEHLTRVQRPFLHPESLQIFRFTASPLQFTHLLQGSDQRTPDTRSETIPSSRITPDLQIHSFFSSVHLTHLLQGSDQRTHDTRSETIPSSRITPDLQIHSFFSSVHSLIFYRVQVREHLTRDQRPFLHPESLQIFRFTASPLQFTHSSSTGFRSENTWPEIRDHSFIQNHSRSSDSQLLLFSSPHSSSTGFRSENTWHEIRDHSFIQNHSRSSDSQLLLFSSPHSSSTGFRSENTWHEIRDHSFIQNHSRSSDTQLLLFSSLTHLLQGSGQRTPDPRSETIPSSRITPDLQIHSFFSSVHLTHLLQGSDQRTPDPRSETIPSSRITPDLQIHSFFSSVHLTHLLQGSGQRTPDTRSETIPSSRITPDPSDSQLLLFSSPHSSSTGFRSENTWHEIRDHSFIQNHSRSSDSQLLLFSSLTHLLQGSDQRTPDTSSETIPSSRITPDPSDSQLLLFSSPHSSSTGFRSENTWHEIRDHSFIQNHSRSSDSQLLLFSSLTHLLQGSGQRTPDTRSETIPSSRITPDLQIHSFFSSLHLTHLLQGSDQRTPDTRSETIPSSRITPDLQIHSFSSSPHSSSTGFRSENTWHEIRDHSFIQNHSRSSDTQLLLFSSLTHLLQGSDQRTPDTRSETIPSSRITPDLQIHSFFSSVHSLIFYRVQIREHMTRDQRPFLHPESLQIFRFTASSLQFTHSSSTGFRSENTWHEIRDHSFIQNHSRSSDSQLLLFSSLIFYRVQVREHLTRDQRPFLHPESLQIFRFTASSLQFTSLIFYRVQIRGRNGQSRSLVLCSVTHFCVVFEVCVWIIVRLEDTNMAHYKISNRVSHSLIFYLLVFDRSHDAMCLNKMSRPPAEI